MDHDTGFAPNVDGGVCSLCGCKTTTIEKWARNGSWVIGIGGNGTTKSDMLIYMMAVDEVLARPEFQKKYPAKSPYLKNTTPEASRVLVARTFYYLGKRAIPLPNNLKHLVAHRQERKLVTDEDVAALRLHLANHGIPVGVRGAPNRPETPCKACGQQPTTATQPRSTGRCRERCECQNGKSRNTKEVKA
jgi:hypothetical protein